MKKKYRIIVPIYDIPVEVYLCEYEELPYYLRGEDRKGPGYTNTIEEDYGNIKICIWIEDFGWTVESIGTLVHELSHTVDRIANNRSFELDTESRAYLLTYLFEEFLNRIDKDLNKKREPLSKRSTPSKQIISLKEKKWTN